MDSNKGILTLPPLSNAMPKQRIGNPPLRSRSRHNQYISFTTNPLPVPKGEIHNMMNTKDILKNPITPNPTKSLSRTMSVDNSLSFENLMHPGGIDQSLTDQKMIGSKPASRKHLNNLLQYWNNRSQKTAAEKRELEEKIRAKTSLRSNIINNEPIVYQSNKISPKDIKEEVKIPLTKPLKKEIFSEKPVECKEDIETVPAEIPNIKSEKKVVNNIKIAKKPEPIKTKEAELNKLKDPLKPKRSIHKRIKKNNGTKLNPMICCAILLVYLSLIIDCIRNLFDHWTI